MIQIDYIIELCDGLYMEYLYNMGTTEKIQNAAGKSTIKQLRNWCEQYQSDNRMKALATKYPNSQIVKRIISTKNIWKLQ